MFNKLKNKDGVALLTVVLIFFVLVIILIGVMFASLTNQSNSIRANEYTAAYYVAESGLNVPMARAEEIFNEARENTWSQSQFNAAMQQYITDMQIKSLDTIYLKDNYGRDAYVNFSVEEVVNENYPDYTFFSVVATGVVGNVQRQVESGFGYRIEQGPGEFNTFFGAIVTQNGIDVDFGGQTNLRGPIATNFGPIEVRGSLCTNISSISYYEMAQVFTDCGNEKIKSLEEMIEFSEIELPDRNELALSVIADKPINNSVLDLRKQTNEAIPPSGPRVYTTNAFNNPLGTLTVQIDGTNDFDQFILLVNNPFNLPSNITIQGKGRVIVLVDFTSNLRLHSNITYQPEAGVSTRDPSAFSLVLYRTGSDTASLISNQSSNDSFNGSILTNSRNSIQINGLYSGYLVTEATNVLAKTSHSNFGSLDTAIWIYAPNADFIQQAGSVIYGSVMAKSFAFASAGNTLIYSEQQAFYPFAPWTPLPYTDQVSEGSAELLLVYLPTIEQ